MRTILFLIFVSCTGVFAQAQDAPQPKVQPVTMPIANLVAPVNVVIREQTKVTAIFILKNSRVKRALTFTIEEKDAKLV